jgi:oligopeptide/dipeptide ABC transporter ATP-binding protein
MALAGEPRLLIADEPTTALDVTIQAQIIEELKRLRATTGMAILFITHDLGVIAQLCDRVLVMYAGRIVEGAPADAFFAGPRHPYSLGLLASMPSIGGGRDTLSCIPGTQPRPDGFPTGCRFHPRCPLADRHCKAEYPSLSGPPGHTVACWKTSQAVEELSSREAWSVDSRHTVKGR